MSGQSLLARAAFLLSFGLFLFSLTHAALAVDPPFRAELSGPILDLDTGLTTNLGGVSVAYNSKDNEYRVVWFDSRISGQNDVYAQRVAPDGSLLGGNVTIISDSNSETDTAVAYDPSTNQYFITWRYQGGPPGSPGFNHAFGGLASATGGLVSGPIDVSNGGLEATLAYNSSQQEFFLEARNFAGGGVGGIRGQRVSNAGALVGGGISIATSGAPAPAGQVCYNSNTNQYLATWRDQTASNLKGRIINGDGTLPGSAFVISSMFPESGLASSVAFDPVNGLYLVVFSEFSAGGVYGQFLDITGNLHGSAFTIIPTTGDRLSPFVAYDGVNHAFLVAWTNSATDGLHAQLLYADGSPAGDTLEIPNPGSPAGPPPIAANSVGGGFIVAWADHTYSPSQRHDILAQRIDVVPIYLSSDVNSISAGTGGSVNFSLTARSANAGRTYLLLGGVTGTSPGTPLPGGMAILPLNWDLFTGLVIGLVNTPIFSNFMGALDGTGSASATFDTIGPVPGAAGVTMHFAYALNNPWDFASEAVGIAILP